MKSAANVTTPAKPPHRYRLLEQITSAVLLIVLAALGWMIVAAYRPEWGRLASLDVEIMLMIGLLLAALVLVSLVALLHTRRREEEQV